MHTQGMLACKPGAFIALFYNRILLLCPVLRFHIPFLKTASWNNPLSLQTEDFQFLLLLVYLFAVTIKDGILHPF